jgi:hypothetical protein
MLKQPQKPTLVCDNHVKHTKLFLFLVLPRKIEPYPYYRRTLRVMFLFLFFN